MGSNRQNFSCNILRLCEIVSATNYAFLLQVQCICDLQVFTVLLFSMSKVQQIMSQFWVRISQVSEPT